MNPTGRFSDRADDYARFRPSYPGAAVDAVLARRAGAESVEQLTVVDVGAGTGISSRLLADRVARVIAVEPNAAMRAAAVEHPRVEWVAGTAEDTGLPSSCADVVACFQAFHWARQEEAMAEFSRVLRSRGRVAIVWNTRDKTSALMTEYRDAIRAVGGEHPAEAREFRSEVIASSGYFSPAQLLEFSNVQELDEEGLIGRVMSASYAPKLGEPAAALRRSLREIHARHRDANGMVALRYVTQVYLADRLM